MENVEQQGIPSVAVIDRLFELMPARVLSIDGYTHIDKDDTVQLFKPPMQETIKVATLSGFVSLIEQNINNWIGLAAPSDYVVHVVDFDTVELVSTLTDALGRRNKHIVATYKKPERSFKFNEFMQQEEFLIGLKSMFVPTDERDLLVKDAGLIASNAEVKGEDDGFGQNVTMKAGVALKVDKTIKPEVTLKPFRTFLDVEQPDGLFIFRIRPGNLCALFEADGGRWKSIAMDSIKAWIEQRIKTSSIEAVANLPVVS